MNIYFQWSSGPVLELGPLLFFKQHFPSGLNWNLGLCNICLFWKSNQKDIDVREVNHGPTVETWIREALIVENSHMPVLSVYKKRTFMIKEPLGFMVKIQGHR